MTSQYENIIGMRKKIDAQADHIRRLEIRIHELRTAQAQHSVPEGWMLVPVEPTQAQLSAGQTAWLADPMRRSTTLYRAMLAAAPQPVTEGE